MSATYAFLSGALMLGTWTAGAFFFRFWSKTQDRLFLLFGVSFWLLGVERVVLILMKERNGEEHPSAYLFRLVAFSLIIVAIADKNRLKNPP